MKTIEEAKYDYCDNLKMSPLTTKMDIIEQNMNAFDAGVEFAQRWIPIEEEFPPVNRTVLIQYDDAIVGVLKYKKYIGFTSYRSDLSKITHWRPIELK